MASATSPSTPSGGVGSSMWANQAPNRQGWGRGGEPGSAFRGMTRGRPGRGGGRGGRGGGRGGNRAAAGPNSPHLDGRGSKLNGAPAKDAKDDSPNPPPPAPAVPSTSASTNKTPSPALSKASASSKDTKPRPRKASEARAPRKVVPPIVIEPAPIVAVDSPVSATTPIRSRRKRSQTQNRSSSSVSSSKKSPSSESSTSHLRAERSPVITKDLPPHLVPQPPPDTPSFDIKHNIDALVERVRAVAMDRPNTPGSHIDWAGEDDDSLPDLDDWGVKSVTDKSTSSGLAEPSEKPDLLSPMLADALKPLPSIDVGSPLAVPTAPPEFPPTATGKGGLGDNTPRVPQPSSRIDPKTALVFAPEKPRPAGPKKQGERRRSDASGKPPPPSNKSASDQVDVPKPSPPKQANVPLHPSLPAKPVGAIDALGKRAPRKAPVPVQTPDPSVDVDAPLKSGLSESMHALKSNGLGVPENPSSASPSPERQGVSASIHAPVQSAPSNFTSHSTPNFRPGHGRAHTMGRPRDLRVPMSAPHASFLDGPSSDDRASRRDRINHARTHSSPPTGSGTSTAHSRSAHATRPVITVAALSGIVRALGASPPKREAGSVAAASKD